MRARAAYVFEPAVMRANMVEISRLGEYLQRAIVIADLVLIRRCKRFIDQLPRDGPAEVDLDKSAVLRSVESVNVLDGMPANLNVLRSGRLETFCDNNSQFTVREYDGVKKGGAEFVQ